MEFAEVLGAGQLILSAVLAFLTWQLARSNWRMSRSVSEPHVVATLEPSQWSAMHADMIVENSGTGVAYDVSISFDPPIPNEDNNDKHMSPIQSISVLRPQQRMNCFIGGFSKLIDVTFDVSISWRRHPMGRREYLTYKHHCGQYKGTSTLGEANPAVQIARDLKQIKEAALPVLRGNRKLKSDVYTSKDRADAFEKSVAAFEAMQAGKPDKENKK